VKFSTATEKDADDKDWRESRKAEKKEEFNTRIFFNKV
jgi:hypothetical protein